MRKNGRILLGVLLALLVAFIPAGPDFTPVQRRMAATVVLMAAWWIAEAIPIPATALLPLALFPLLGILSSRATAAAYGDHLVFLFLGGFLIAVAMERWELHRRIAVATIARLGAGPKRLLAGAMIATAFLSMWISNTATTLMMVPIAAAVVGHVVESLPQGRRREAEYGLGALLMLGIAYAASIGGIATLVGTPPNIVFSGFMSRLFPDRYEITFLKWMFVGVPFAVVALPITGFVVWRFGGSAGVRQIDPAITEELIREERTRIGPMTGPEKVVATVFALTALLWITRRPVDLGGFEVPGWSALLPWPDSIHDATVAIFMAVLLFILPVREAEEKGGGVRPVLTWDEAAARVPWGILLLFGGGFALAAGFRETGLDVWLGSRLGALTHAPITVVVLATCLLTTFLTEVTSNTATATLLMPVLAAAAEGGGIAPHLLMLPAALAASCAFMLPVATPPNAIVFGTGWVTIPRMARTGVLLNLVLALLITLVTLTLGRWAF